MLRSMVVLGALLACSLGAGSALAKPPSPGSGGPSDGLHARAERAAPRHGAIERGADGHGVGEPGAGEHEPEHRGAGKHGAEAHGHHEAPGELNWFHGFLGESDEVEPGLLYRPKGAPAPLLALLLNTAIVFLVVYHFGRQPIAEGLRARRAAILKGIEDAAAMKREAAGRLAEYQDRLDHIDDEVARVEREMRAAGDSERARVLEDARRKRELIERDAHVMVAMEAKSAAVAIRAAMVRSAVNSARDALKLQTSGADQRRLLDEYLVALRTSTDGGAG